MSRYLLDGRPLQGDSAMRGIGTYLRGLLHGLRAAGAIDDVHLLLEGGAPLPGWDASRVDRTRLRAVNRHLRPFIDPFQVRRALTRSHPDLYHAVEYAQPVLPRLPVVVTVHDLIPFVMPSLYPWMRRERWLAMRQLRRADAVIAVSRSTAADVSRIASVDPDRVAVIPEAVLPAEGPAADLDGLRRRLRLTGPFLLAVGTFDPRKRIDLLVEVVRRVRVEHDVALVIAGHQGNFAAEVERQVARAGLSGHVRVLGHVSAGELRGLYQLAACLVFTSAYEGFGLPPLEAMAAGCPAAVFDNSSLGEVVGEAALLVPDGDAPAMASAVSGLVAGPEERRRLVDAGRERAASFSWDKAAVATLGVYRRVLERR